MSQKAVVTCGVLTVGVGSLNSVAKQKELPSARFLIGAGVAFTLLSFLAEAEPEVAQALAVAVLVTVLLGEGDGVLSYLNQRGELDTSKKQPARRFTPPQTPASPVAVNRQAQGRRTVVTSPQSIVIPGIPGNLAN
jgi:hypothetical protein